MVDWIIMGIGLAGGLAISAGWVYVSIVVPERNRQREYSRLKRMAQREMDSLKPL